jgi:hypothetical protein
LNVIADAAVREPAPRVTLVRSRTVENVDSKVISQLTLARSGTWRVNRLGKPVHPGARGRRRKSLEPLCLRRRSDAFVETDNF